MAIGTLIPMIAASAGGAGRAAIIRRFSSSGATSPASAISFSPHNNAERRMFEAMLQQGLIAEATSTRFYLNEDELAAFDRKQVRVIRAIASTALVALTTALIVLR